jgi:hypothetical protein
MRAASKLVAVGLIAFAAISIFALIRRRSWLTNRQGTTAAPVNMGRRIVTFALVDAAGERRSMEWRFVLAKNDIYLAPYLHFGAPRPSIFHASLHADRRCHWTYDSKYWNSLPPERRGLRRTREWVRPPTNADNPSVLGYAITFLPDPAGSGGQGIGEQFNHAAPAPALGRATELQLIFSLAGPSCFDVTGGRILDHHRLASGETVYFVLFETPYDPSGLVISPNLLVRELGSGGPKSHTRIAAWIDPDDSALLNTVLDVPAETSIGPHGRGVTRFLI